MTSRIGKYFKTIPEIEAMDRANKAQIADTLAYYKKAQKYNTCNIMSDIMGRLTPGACTYLDPPLTKHDFSKENKTIVKLNQWLYRQVLANFKETEFCPQSKLTTKEGVNNLEKALSLWWMWANKDVIKGVENLVGSTGDLRTVIKNAYNTYTSGVDKYNDLLGL